MTKAATRRAILQELLLIQSRVTNLEQIASNITHGQDRLRADVNALHLGAVKLARKVGDLATSLDRIERRFEVVNIN